MKRILIITLLLMSFAFPAYAQVKGVTGKGVTAKGVGGAAAGTWYYSNATSDGSAGFNTGWAAVSSLISVTGNISKVAFYVADKYSATECKLAVVDSAENVVADAGTASVATLAFSVASVSYSNAGTANFRVALKCDQNIAAGTLSTGNAGALNMSSTYASAWPGSFTYDLNPWSKYRAAICGGGTCSTGP